MASLEVESAARALIVGFFLAYENRLKLRLAMGTSFALDHETDDGLSLDVLSI